MADTNHELVKEAQNRHNFEQMEAFGEVDGEKLYLLARLRKEKHPELVAMYGGHWEHYPEEDIDDEYVRHTRTLNRLERVDMLVTRFNALVEKYDLSREVPERWKNGGGTGATADV